ncbi:leucyl/phenylalanyl-tRNA--protein transferase [Tsuneonella mangrovi]|uniref:leucyl/phenylalanyl-tRNA--protein transferase n=1 Tax=Tsuneonella mangrovi TaxID=1982042 RepID=UPI003B82FA93
MHAPASPLLPSDLLLLAYRNGIFPMADGRDDADVFWVEPKKRAIIPLDGLKVSRSLRKVVRQARFEVTCNRAFAEVIDACAAPRPGHPDTWISPRIAASYRNLHAEGHAHSIECWQDGELVGGLYGVGFGGVFCGESMFSRADDASKVALVWLVGLLRRAKATLLDCQFMTDHLASMGAIEIPQKRYCALLEVAAGLDAATLPEAFAALEGAARSTGASPAQVILQSSTHTS